MCLCEGRFYWAPRGHVHHTELIVIYIVLVLLSIFEVKE